MGASGFPMRPAEYSVSGLTSVALTFLSCARLTAWFSTRNGLVNPRLGSRRYIGIWPPSKPGLVEPPVRALWPLCPLPEVLPRPEPGPRPTRLRAGEEPAAGRRDEREMRSAIVCYSENLKRGLHPALTSTICRTLYNIPRTEALLGSCTVCW